MISCNLFCAAKRVRGCKVEAVAGPRVVGAAGVVGAESDRERIERILHSASAQVEEAQLTLTLTFTPTLSLSQIPSLTLTLALTLPNSYP